MEIDPRPSEHVIAEKIAGPLGLDLLDAAYTIWRTSHHNMVTAIEDIAVLQGVDPRGYMLIAGGGASGLHIMPIRYGS